MAPQRTEAPPAVPPLYGLIIGAPSIDNVDPDVWGAGFTFAPEGCGNGGRNAVDCFGSTNSRTPEDNAGYVTGDPFLVWGADRCSTFGFKARDYRGRAERQLAAIESYQIANELWGGSLTTGEGLSNRYLTDVTSDTVTNGAVDPTVALALLVGGLGICGQGQLGMIHVTPQLLVYLVAADAVVRDGVIWRTPMGHRVIADAGYPGTGPGGSAATTTQWAYATSTIRTARGPVETTDFNEAVERDINSVSVYAQRLALFEWSSTCCHLAAEVNVPVPLVGPPS